MGLKMLSISFQGHCVQIDCDVEVYLFYVVMFNGINLLLKECL